MIVQPPLKPLPVQEDFYLLDVIGGARNLVLHPTKPIAAYSTGCMIIVYDMLTDSKINLVHHQHEVQALAFSSPGSANSQSGGDFLVSVDFDRNDLNDLNSVSNSTMCLWNWQKGQCTQEISIPKAQNNNGFVINNNGQQRFIQIVFEKVGGMFFVMESGSSEIGGGYRATLWNLGRQQRIDMISQLELELQNVCLGLTILPKTTTTQSVSNQGTSQYSSQAYLQQSPSLRFLTLESHSIKLWSFTQGHADLTKLISLKQPLLHLQVSDLTHYLLLLGQNGRVLILDQEGEFVSAVKREHTHFTTIGTAHDKMLLGTDRGTICVYHMASLQFINEVPYQLGGISGQFELNQSDKINVRSQSPTKLVDNSLSLFKIGPPVSQVMTTQNLRFLLIKYLDSSFAMIDRTAVQNPQQAIMGYQYGHFQKVTSIKWINNNPRKGYKQSNLLQDKRSQSSFITCAHDMSVFVWRHFGDRWQFSFIDVVKCFDQSLSYQRKLNEKSTQNLQLTSLCLYPRSPLICIGDNKGIIRVFQISQEKALFVASHHLLKSQDLTQSDDSIKDIYITKDESLAIVSFQSGLICCYDLKNSFNLIGIIEKDAQRFCYSNQLQVHMKVLEQDDKQSLSFSNLRVQDERPYTNTSFDNQYDVIGANSYGNNSHFRILSTTSPNCVSLQNVQVKGNKLIKTPISQFIIDEGKIAGFDVHPSNDYLLITSNQGRIFMYRIDTGELRGTIKIPLHARDCVIDPSGLYVIVQVPPFSGKNTINLGGQDTFGQSELQTLGTHENDIERTTILMFEVGTARVCAEIKSVFEVSAMQFSEDGKFLTMGSNNGAVCVWAIGEHLQSNIKQVLDSVQMQSDFWANYPIFLPDYGIYGKVMAVEQPFLTTQSMPVDDYRQQERQEDYMNQQKQNVPQIPSYSNSQRSNMLSNHQQISANRPQSVQQQKQSYIRQPVTQIDRSIQNTTNKQQSDYLQQNLQQQKQQIQQAQENKFYRKTFVEDQQTQVTPHHSYLQNQQQQSIRNTSQPKLQQQQQPQIYNTQSQRSAQIQTQPLIPVNQGYNRQVNAQESAVKQQALNNYASKSSLLSSPNRAELLYSDAYLHQSLPKTQQQLTQQYANQDQNQQPMIQNPYNQTLQQTAYQSIDNHQMGYNQQPQMLINPYAQQQTQQQNNGIQVYQQPIDQQQYQMPYQQQYQQQQFPTKTIQRPDFIDRTTQNKNKDKAKQIFIDSEDENPINLGGSIGKGIMHYEENLDAAQLYNPFIGGNIPPIEKGGDNSILPYSTLGIGSSPIKPMTNYQTGRMKQSAYKANDNAKAAAQDPIDIDDDVSGGDPINDNSSGIQKEKELDVMAKYMNNIRIPTRHANDDFIAQNGYDGEKAYTLQRLRQEDRMMEIGAGPDEFADVTSNAGSNYDLVDEMYENLNSFDKRIKAQKIMRQDRFAY